MQTPVYLLSSVVGLSTLWFVWSLGIKKLWLDRLRERLFEQRFELFRLGMSGELPFESDTYRSLEILFCGLLRFGHRITFLTYIFSTIEQKSAKQDKDYVDSSMQIALKISRLQPETQQKLTKILNDVRSELLRYMAITSLLFLGMAVVFTIAKIVGLWHPETAKEEVGRVIEREAYRAESMRPLRVALA